MSYSSISSSSEAESELSFPIPSSGDKTTMLSEREEERDFLHYSSPSSSEAESDLSFPIPGSSNQTALSPENEEETYAIHSQFPKPILMLPNRTRPEHPKPRRKIRFAREPSTRRGEFNREKECRKTCIQGSTTRIRDTDINTNF